MLPSDYVHSALAEAAGGAVAGAIADGVLYGLDSAKVRSQGHIHGSQSPAILFRGFVPSIVLGSVPVFGCFFLLYAPVRDYLQESQRPEVLPLAAAACAVPATVIGIPADVIKKRLVLGVDDSVMGAVHHAMHQRGGGKLKGLFAGVQVNLVRDIPFAAVKMALYEGLVYQVRKYSKLNPKEPLPAMTASLCGTISGVACAILTCPLDVINTRIKSGETTATSIRKVGREIVQAQGVRALFAGVFLRSIVLGIGSSIFWPLQHGVAHALHSSEYNRVHDTTNHDILSEA